MGSKQDKVSIAAKICHQVKPEFPLSPMDDNYMYP